MEFFLALAVTHFVALLSPGPDFFLILTTVLNYNKVAAQKVCWGIAMGNAIILLIIFLSWYFIGKINVSILQYLKWIGACYLFYLSFLCLRHAKTKIDTNQQHQIVKKQFMSLKPFLLGFQSSLLNPKNILFYSSMTLIVSEKFDFYQKIAVCTWMVMVVLSWNLFLVNILTNKRGLNFLRVQSQWLYCISSLSFFIFAGLLIFLPN